jgi:Domain of unknown function (DUF4304)
MITTAKDLELFLNPIFAEHGFKKRGRSWYRVHPETIHVGNLQRSDWGEIFYLNYGISLKALLSAEYPRPEQCGFGIRLERFLEQVEPFQRALNLTKPMLEGCEREQTIAAGTSTVLKYLEALTTADSLSKALQADPRVRPHTSVALRKYLER